jgi:TRAP-type C4-dicarboxylate transport system permease small subunit
MLFTVLSLGSCALFVYLAVAVQSLAGTDESPTDIFRQPFVYLTEFCISALFALYYLFMLFTSTTT